MISLTQSQEYAAVFDTETRRVRGVHERQGADFSSQLSTASVVVIVIAVFSPLLEAELAVWEQLEVFVEDEVNGSFASFRSSLRSSLHVAMGRGGDICSEIMDV